MHTCVNCRRIYQPLLHDQGWKYDAFLCYKGHTKSETLVKLLYKKLLQRGVVSFFDKNAFRGGESVQEDIAQAIGLSPFFVVITSHEMKGAKYPEAEARAALAFSKQEKSIIPIFYGMTADECSGCDILLYQKLSSIAGFETRMQQNDDATIVTGAADFIKNAVQRQLQSRILFTSLPLTITLLAVTCTAVLQTNSNWSNCLLTPAKLIAISTLSYG